MSLEFSKKELVASGPVDADVVILGEAPGRDEEKAGKPFVGTSGQQLTKLLQEVGIQREDCYLTNVCKVRPPDNNINKFFLTKTAAEKKKLQEVFGQYPTPEIRDGLSKLQKELQEVNPKMVICLGNTALWAMTGEWGIGKWRGSMLHAKRGIARAEPRVLPTYHPAAMLRQWYLRKIILHDLRRAQSHIEEPWPEPNYRFTIYPDYSTALGFLEHILRNVEREPTPISCDLETNGQIAVIGLGVSSTEAICIPFFSKSSPEGYWNAEQELEIVLKLKQILEHPNARVIGQNYEFDRQYLARIYGIVSQLWLDTQTLHHTCFPTLPKSLDFQSSIYCRYHTYWKDETKIWDPGMDEERFFRYNCIDCVVTWECGRELQRISEKMGVWGENEDLPANIQMNLHYPVLRATARGVKIDMERKQEIARKLEQQMEERADYFREMVGEQVGSGKKAYWWDSPTQTAELFYDELGVKKVVDPSSGNPTTKGEALRKIPKREPILTDLCQKLEEYRSLGVYLRTFAYAPVDWDGRIRCQWKIDGTETFRFASSADAFGFGTNLENIPKGREDEETGMELPNIRSMFIPDEGYMFWDSDLSQADARIVAWESDCKYLKDIFNDPEADLHDENCKIIFNRYPKPGPDRDSPKGIRQLSKHIVHAANYGATAKTLAARFGITVKEAENFLNNYFSAAPEIPEWHDRVEAEIQQTRKITNAFGYSRQFFDRIENALKEALAWVPQSSVAIATNKGMLNIENNIPYEDAHWLLQVHDSLAGQVRADRAEELKPRIEREMEVIIPYDDPLTIPVELKLSSDSWGECG